MVRETVSWFVYCATLSPLPSLATPVEATTTTKGNGKPDTDRVLFLQQSLSTCFGAKVSTDDSDYFVRFRV